MDKTNFRIIVAVACALAFYAGYASAGEVNTDLTECEERADRVADAYRRARTIEVGGGLLADLTSAALNGRNPSSGASSAIRNGSRGAVGVANKRQQELERCERENARSVSRYGMATR